MVRHGIRPCHEPAIRFKEQQPSLHGPATDRLTVGMAQGMA
jgi:hypothetical protein